MNISKVERVTGLSVTVSQDGKTATAKRGGVIVFVARGAKTQKAALDLIVKLNYTEQRIKTAREQGFRCFCCNRLGSLETDHIIERGIGSANRDDRRTNLRSMLVECHHRRHREPANPPAPHPEILQRLSEYGYRWGGEERGWLKTST